MRATAVLVGAGATVLWQLLAGVLAWSAWSLGVLQTAAAVASLVVAAVLARSGDRGVAVGVAAAAGIALSLVLPVILVVMTDPFDLSSPTG